MLLHSTNRIILFVVSACESRYGTCYTLLKDKFTPLVDRYLVLAWYRYVPPHLIFKCLL
jgi:hypothetical protein